MKKTILRLVLACGACAFVPVIPRAVAAAPAYAVQNEVKWPENSIDYKKVHLAPKSKNDIRKLLAEVTGEAMMAFVVDVTGKTTNIQVAKATSPEFGEAAKKAVEQWQFAPGMMNGKPVAVRMMFPLSRK